MMAKSESTRATLLLRLRDRTDELSWQEFHDRYGELLYRYARSRGASAVDAEDIVQEVEMYLVKAMEGFEYDTRKGRFRAYLRASVVRAMGRRADKKKREGDLLDPQHFDYLAAIKDAASDDRWEREWRQHRLRWALRRVEPEFESQTINAFCKHVLGGESVEATAEQLELSKASVYQAKSRVLRRVREVLDSLDPDEDV